MYRYGTASNQSAFRSATPLTTDQILRHAPSVLATEAHASRGERYAYVPTGEILQAMEKEGFRPYEVRQTRCRDMEKRAFTKHMVRLRHDSGIADAKGEQAEIILVNSHDGTSSYQLMAGFFRMVCSNGLIAGDVCNDIRIRHMGNIVDDVIEGSYTVLSNLQEIAHHVDQYKAITVTPAEANLLADQAVLMRWDEAEEAPVRGDQLLRLRRWDDKEPTLWNTFNVIQENLMKGGISGRDKSGKRRDTRGVTGVNENIRLNKALWSITDHFAKVKLSA